MIWHIYIYPLIFVFLIIYCQVMTGLGKTAWSTKLSEVSTNNSIDKVVLLSDFIFQHFITLHFYFLCKWYILCICTINFVILRTLPNLFQLWNRIINIRHAEIKISKLYVANFLTQIVPIQKLSISLFEVKNKKYY